MTTQTPVLSVSQLNRQVRSWLEHEMGIVNVEGEISNLSKPASGHFYFTLKDSTAQIRCVYFRNRHSGSDFIRLQNGQQVLINGNLSLYEARGDYQLIIEQIHEAGEGDLYKTFELLKTKLMALGLFEATRKRPLPRFPHCIGVVTSASAAALRDILSTLERRFPIARVLVYTSEVQGTGAAQQLIDAINRANHDQRCDVLIVARGGGSIEDLWAFNDELLAHTIFNSGIPIVSGVGHETDFTIADFVADLRAETPTAAAVAVTPNWLELVAFLQRIETQLLTSITRFIKHQQLMLQHEAHKLTSPKQLVSSHWQSLDYLSARLQHALQQIIAKNRTLIHDVNHRLEATNPALLVQLASQRLKHLEHGLVQQAHFKINNLKQQFLSLLATLHAVSPLATLDRGFAIATCKKKVILDSQTVTVGDVVDIRLAKGEIRAKITATSP